MRITILEINLKFALVSFKNMYPPEAVRNNAGKVAIPKINIANAAKIGLLIAVTKAKAPQSKPQGMNPRIIPKK